MWFIVGEFNILWPDDQNVSPCSVVWVLGDDIFHGHCSNVS